MDGLFLGVKGRVEGWYNIFIDIFLLYPMLNYIKSDYIHPEVKSEKSNEKIYHYTCKHFDNSKRICTIYDVRPTMCRIYGVKSVCNNPKCKWKKQIDWRKQISKENKSLVKKNTKEVKLK
jgi:Fe-S-cluster containining protein